MELVIQDWKPSQSMFISYGIVIFCMLTALFAVVINIRIKKKRGKNIDIDEVLQTVLVMTGLIFGLVLSVQLIYKDFLYIFDYKSNNQMQAEEVIIDVDYSRRYCKIWTEEGTLYSIGDNNFEIADYREASEYIEENFLGHECIIKYFRLSKYIKMIKIKD